MVFVSRRTFGLAVALLTALSVTVPASGAPGDDPDGNPLSREAVLRDPDIVVLGNPKGDITIVEYFDYQCPYCKKAAPDVAKVVKDDGHVRLVFKDWPILGDPSPYAARLVLASKYQGKYEVAHDALMGRTGRLTEAVIDEVLAGAGVDIAKAKADLEANKVAIDALLKRNDAQAQAFGFQGTPAFIVGTFRIPGALSVEHFKQAIADARARAKDETKGKSK